MEEGSSTEKTRDHVTHDSENESKESPEYKRVASFCRAGALLDLHKQMWMYTYILSSTAGPCQSAFTLHPQTVLVAAGGIALIMLVEYFDVDIIGRLPKALVYNDRAGASGFVETYEEVDAVAGEKEPLLTDYDDETDSIQNTAKIEK